MFERPIKGDLDRSLSLLMHDSRHKLMDECNRIKSEAIKAGALRSNRLISTVVKAADQLHKQAMDQALPVLLDFIERMQLAPAQITSWARPHLENLGNSLLGVVPPNGFPADYKRIRAQYAAVFQQRLDGVLRDVEIGFVKGAGFARVEQVESKEEWITAADALAALKPTLTTYSAQIAICKRAYNGLIRARAERLIVDEKVSNNVEIPKEFWWSEGHTALTQNWTTGDFDTWIDLSKITVSYLSGGEVHLQAFGVTFVRADIEKLIPAGTPALAAAQAPPVPAATVGGRPPAEFWDNLWIEIFRQIYLGELKPKTQADITNAMLTWIEHRGEKASESTVKSRARKLFQALRTWDKN
jgi:hypothetical protein